MPHIYNDVHKLEGKPPVGDGDCVALVQTLTDVGWTGKLAAMGTSHRRRVRQGRHRHSHV